ncbi:MAG: hypothetical protein ACFHWX_02020 [Bacteroidota bacterium]
MKRYFFGLLIFVFLGYHSISQEVIEERYLFPEFVDGTMLMKDGKKRQVIINYDKATEEMILFISSMKLTIARTEIELIDTIYMEERKFVRMDNKFLEFLDQSVDATLYVQHKCNVIYHEGGGKYVGVGTGPRYQIIRQNESFFQGDYSVEPYLIYWIRKDNVMNEITTLSDLKKVYSRQKAKLNKYIRNNKVEFEDTNQLMKLIGYLEEESQ